MLIGKFNITHTSLVSRASSTEELFISKNISTNSGLIPGSTDITISNNITKSFSTSNILINNININL